jgi:prepilin-type N-terminal cleavage/methylation domain-containing protein
MTIFKNKNSGFTILELLITLGILSFVILAATKLLTSNIHAVQTMVQSIHYTQNLRIATNQINDRIKKDNSVKVACNGSVLMINNRPLLDVNKKLTDTDNNAQLWLYDKGDDTAELRDHTGNDRVLADYIKSIELKDQPNGDPSYLNIIITVLDTPAAVLSVPKTFSFASEIPETPPENPNKVWQNFVTYSQKMTLADSIIYGPTTIVDITDQNPSNTTSLTNNNTVVRTAQIYVNNNLYLDMANLGYDQNSSIYVNGNVTYQNQLNIVGKIYYTGTFYQVNGGVVTPPHSYKVSSITLPSVSLPTPQPDSWYTGKGFTSNATPRNDMKYKGGSITFTNQTNVSNVCVYSTGDITIDNSSTVGGILYAPNGTATVNSSTFNGIIIANNIHIYNSSHVNYQTFDVNLLPF